MAEVPIPQIPGQTIGSTSSSRSPEADEALRTALAHANLGNFLDAVADIRRAIHLESDDPELYGHLARFQAILLRVDDAAAAYREALRLAPSDVRIYEAFGAMLMANQRKQEALELRIQAAQIAPTADRLAVLAAALIESGRPAEAEEYARRAIDLDGSNSRAFESLGFALLVLGRVFESQEAFRRSIDADSRSVRPYLGYSASKRIGLEDREFKERLEHAATDASLNRSELRDINYALGKAYADLGQYGAAMRCYDLANQLEPAAQKAESTLTRANRRRWHEGLTKTFTEKFFRDHRNLGSSSETPIFVLGMIRSGTTLAEQILSSHPLIGAGGEIPFWMAPDRAMIVRKLIGGTMVRSELAETADAYVEVLHGLTPETPRVTDKMPLNYLNIGLIHLLFPNARIIHCRRNPIDTCLSIYMTPGVKGPDFCYSRRSIVDGYMEYLALMEHWRHVIPSNRLLEIDYESVVANNASEAKRMIAFCGLEWNDACLEHDRNARPIQTPSLWQARQPIYGTSVEKWRHFEPWLREFDHLRNVNHPAPLAGS
ncbi:MAG: sulfotransferase [Fimbriimonas sp.]|nr:sulfotransferase [Fimbriimonas sp.]